MGLINPHFIGYAPEWNEDKVVEITDRMGASWALVVNDVKAVKKLLAAKKKVVFRVVNARFYDDSAHDNLNAEEYLNFCAWLLAQDGVDVKDVVLYYNNEAGNASMPKLKAQLQVALAWAERNNVELVILNIAFMNWNIEDWEYIEDELIWAVRLGCYVGFHEGYYRGMESLATASPHSIGRFEYVLKRFNLTGHVLITEFAGSFDPYWGWRRLYNGDWRKWAQRIAEAVAGFYKRYNIPIFLFTAFEWQHDFDFNDDIDFQWEVARYNLQFPYLEMVPIMIVDSLQYMCPENGVKRKLTTGEVVKTGRVGNIYYQYKNGQWESFFLKIYNGVEWLNRLMDTSSALSSDKYVYALFEDEACTIPGGKSVPRHATVGVVYPRKVWVQAFELDGRKIPAGGRANTGWDTTYFKIVKQHETWTTPEGTQLQDVIECVYSQDYNAVVAANSERSDGILERYFYVRNGGLCGFFDYNPGPNRIKTFVTKPHEWSEPLVPALKFDWWNPVINQTTSPQDPPKGTSPYAALCTDDGVRMRPLPGTASNNVFLPNRSINKGQRVTLYASSLTQLINGHYWIIAELPNGQRGYVARTYFVEVINKKVLKEIALPYFSQILATLKKNDCGPAVVRMMLEFYWVNLKAMLPFALVSVDDITRDTDLMTRDDGLGCGELVTVGSGYGVRFVWLKGLTKDNLIVRTNNSQPTGLLVNSKYIGYAEEFGHFIAVKGLAGKEDGTVTDFIIHDPYELGADRLIPVDNLVQAMNSVGAFTPHGPGQGIGFA